MRLRHLLASLGLGALLIGLPVPAQAADGTSVTHVQPSGNDVQVLVSVPPGAQVDLDAVTVLIGGTEVKATAEPAEGKAVARTAVLAIDTSNSMAGPRFDAAKAAATAYLSSVPADVNVGIVTFASSVTEALAPTTDRQAAESVVAGLRLAKKTRLYDGVIAAAQLAGDEGQRSLLVLSDGADTSPTEVGEATAAIEAAGVLVDVVALDQSGEDLEALSALSAAGSGQVINAGSDALAAAFSDEARVLADQVLVTARVPQTVTTSNATISIALPSGDETLLAEAYAPVRDGDAPATGETTTAPVTLPSSSDGAGLTLPEWGKWAAIGLIGFGLLVILAILLPGSSKRELTAEERVALYTSGAGAGGVGGAHAASASATDQTLAQAKGAAERMLKRNKSLEERIARRLESAGSGWRASEWLLLHTGVVVVSGLLGLLIGRGSLVIGLIFIAIGIVVPWVFLGFKKRRRLKKFNALLPDTLQLMSGSLSAGLSLAQSVDTIVREGSEPVSGEFKRVLVETRLGVSLEDALEGITERFESKDFAWVVMAIRIQRQVGGNLGELLNNVAATIREREYMRRQVAALAAEGKISAYVLGGLPPGFLLFLMLSKPDYVGVLFEEPIGWLMLAGGAVMLGVGAFWMSRLVKVEI